MPRPVCRANYCWEEKRKASKCARNSFRVLKRGTALIRVCCPKGPKHWNRKWCSVGMTLQAIGRKRGSRHGTR